MTGEITEVYRSRATIVGTSNNILFVFAIASPERRDVETVAKIYEKMSPRWPSGLGFMFCARAGVRPPDQEVRDQVMMFLKRISPQLRAMAWVVFGEGFLPAAIRSVFAAVMLAIRVQYPAKVFREVEPGISWMAAQLDGLDGARFDRRALADQATTIAAKSIPPSRASGAVR